MSYEDLKEKHKKQQEKIDTFSELLQDLVNTTDKKKLLWKEIYENALRDRVNAEILFNEAYTSMQVNEHITIGPVLTKYLERMNKSNEQILKLAELISKAEERSERIDPDDLFSQINEG